jgi:hypothetical protein
MGRFWASKFVICWQCGWVPETMLTGIIVGYQIVEKTMLQGSISLPMAALMAASVRVAAPSFMRALSR